MEAETRLLGLYFMSHWYLEQSMQSLVLILVYRDRYFAQELVESKTRVNIELTFIRSPQTQLHNSVSIWSVFIGNCMQKR